MFKREDTRRPVADGAGGAGGAGGAAGPPVERQVTIPDDVQPRYESFIDNIKKTLKK